MLVEDGYDAAGVAPLKPFRSAETAGAALPAEIDREIAMAKVIEARAFCNNEVAYLAWKTDGENSSDCLGFMITRIHLDDDNNEVERRHVAGMGRLRHAIQSRIGKRAGHQRSGRSRNSPGAILPCDAAATRCRCARPSAPNTRLFRSARKRRAGWRCRPHRPRNPANTRAIRFQCLFAARPARPTNST